MNDLQKINFTKNLDTDTEVLYLQQGQFTDALNVRHITDNTESTYSIVPIKGNVFSIEIPSTIQQNKIYKFTITNTIGQNQLTINDQNSNLISIVTWINPIDTLTNIFNNQILSAFATSLSFPQIYIISSLTTSDNITGTFTLSLTTILGRDYTIISTGINVIELDITQEAIDKSLIGEANVIGSYDLLGDLFIWSTSQKNLPSTIATNILTISNTSPLVTITTNINHGFTTNDIGKLINISGNSINAYNGNWIINSVPTTTTFTINIGASSLGSGIGGNIMINIQGIGEIGVMTFDPNTNIYTYVRLIKSKQFNFVTKHQVDTYIEQNSFEKSIYWTDNYNVPRVMYYKGSAPYVQDGALSFTGLTGNLNLDNINTETTLFISSIGADIAFTSQTQTGGALLSGNWRYAIQFVTENGVATDITELSNPIPVFKSNTGASAREMSGDDAGITTTKINNFIVTGIIPGVFKYVQLIGVNYINGATIGYIISKTLFNGNSDTINLSHTGLEIGVQNLDLGTLNTITTVYNTALNLSVVDNRMILSNLSSKQQSDFSLWTQSFNHSVISIQIDAVGLSETTLKIGEYNNPNFVYNFLGYTHNETYRFGARFRLTDGSITNVFWIDDIRIDTSSTNITIPNRRISGLNDYNLTDNSSNIDFINVAGIQFSNINIDFLINGIAVKNLIDEILFERAECIPEILATGMAALAVQQNGLTPVGSLSDTGIFYLTGSGSFTGYNGEYPFINAIRDDGTVILYPSSGMPKRTIFSFYSPDILYGNTEISNSISGDIIFNYGAPQIKATAHGKTIPHHYDSTYAEYNGYTNQTTLTPLLVSTLSNVGFGAIPNTNPLFYSKTLTTYSPYPIVPLISSVDAQWWYIGTPVIQSQSLTNVSSNPDYGFYYIQYKRPRGSQSYTFSQINSSKYGDPALTQYVPTGTRIKTIAQIQTPHTPPSNNLIATVFGGDTFTQKSYVKTRFAAAFNSGGFNNLGFAAGTSFYSQNKVNTQLNKKYDNTFGTWNYPAPDAAIVPWLEPTAYEVEPIHYNKGYNPTNLVNSFIGFDVNAIQLTSFPVRIIWSNLKSQGGIFDAYRVFLPLNFHDLDAGFGEIVHIANGNGELITWQPRKFQRQYFNTRGQLQTSNNLGILIGDGSVMSRNGQTLTVLGSKNKWSIIKGKSAQGNDTFYWINTEMKKAIRFGYDGTVSIADIHGMTSFLANNLAWVDNKDTPADGQGICGVWDDRFAEVIWTVRGKRVINSYDPTLTYIAGNVVSFVPSTFSTFEQTGDFFTANQNVSVGQSPLTNPTKWDIIPHINNQYYNEYTLVFNEYKNGFTSFYSFLPKIYLKWKDTYFSPKPISDTGRLYIHNLGAYCRWYDDEQIVDGYIEGVANAMPDQVKWMAAMRVNSDVIPQRIDFSTFNQISFLTSGEFTSREFNFDSSIKRDSTSTGINDGDTSALYGKYLKVRMSFLNNTYQKLYAIVVKFRLAVRYTQK